MVAGGYVVVANVAGRWWYGWIIFGVAGVVVVVVAGWNTAVVVRVWRNGLGNMG